MKSKILACNRRSGSFVDNQTNKTITYDFYEMCMQFESGKLEIWKMDPDKMLQSGIKDVNVLIGKEWEWYKDGKKVDLIRTPQ